MIKVKRVVVLITRVMLVVMMVLEVAVVIKVRNWLLADRAGVVLQLVGVKVRVAKGMAVVTAVDRHVGMFTHLLVVRQAVR